VGTLITGMPKLPDLLLFLATVHNLNIDEHVSDNEP
jgi:hypothetical protein